MCRDQKVFRRAAVKRKLGEQKERKMERRAESQIIKGCDVQRLTFHS